MLPCSLRNRVSGLSPHYYHVALYRLDKNDYFNQKESHRTIKQLIILFVLEHRRPFKNYGRIARIMHMVRTCTADYKTRYNCKFMYNDIFD